MARYIDDGTTFTEVAPAKIPLGTFSFTDTGICKLYASNERSSTEIAAGDICHPAVCGKAEFVKAFPEDVYRQGEAVFGDVLGQTAKMVAADGKLGVAAQDSRCGDATVVVKLNG